MIISLPYLMQRAFDLGVLTDNDRECLKKYNPLRGRKVLRQVVLGTETVQEEVEALRDLTNTELMCMLAHIANPQPNLENHLCMDSIDWIKKKIPELGLSRREVEFIYHTLRISQEW